MAKTIADYKAEYEIAKAKGDTQGMQAANDAANALRAQTGGVSQYADEDIANVQAQVDAAKALQIPPVSPGSGIWSSQGGAPVYGGSTLPAASDYSAYIRELYRAKEDAALAQMEAAYQKNMTELDAAEAGITPAYQAARDKTAAASEQGKRSFAEYASAKGLNSGASGQAELARSISLQNDLSALNRAEADAFSELDLQRARLSSEYNAAIAAAKTAGAYDLAAALYQEAVRVDQSLVSTALSQAGLDYNKWSSDYTVWQNERSGSRDSAASYGKLWLQYGLMPSDSMLAAMGISRQDAQKLIDKINGI